MKVRSQRSTAEKIRLFARYFTGLTDVYGTYDPATGRSKQIKERVTRKVILAHLQGQRPYGVYLLKGNRTRAIVADFDNNDITAIRTFLEANAAHGIPTYVERSKSKGYHAWVFFNGNGATASKARTAMHVVLSEANQERIEVFPKHDFLTSATPFGNFINAPLFGALVNKGRTVFIDPKTQEPYPDQWLVLERIQSIDEEELDGILERLPAKPLGYHRSVKRSEPPRGDLLPCTRRILSEGVSEYQRVICFRLAIHLKRIGLPYDITVSALKAWAAKNHPIGKRIITGREISTQAADAYDKDYRSLGCEEPALQAFCSADCAVRKWKVPSEKPAAL
jgi:hypothetical protein